VISFAAFSAVFVAAVAAAAAEPAFPIPATTAPPLPVTEELPLLPPAIKNYVRQKYKISCFIFIIYEKKI